MSIDRASILGGQRGAFKGSGIDQAPDTPTGLTANPGQTSASVSANAVPNATGYRFYRRNRTQPGLWNSVRNTPWPRFPGFEPGVQQHIRVQGHGLSGGPGKLRGEHRVESDKQHDHGVPVAAR